MNESRITVTAQSGEKYTLSIRVEGPWVTLEKDDGTQLQLSVGGLSAAAGLAEALYDLHHTTT